MKTKYLPSGKGILLLRFRKNLTYYYIKGLVKLKVGGSHRLKNLHCLNWYPMLIAKLHLIKIFCYPSIGDYFTPSSVIMLDISSQEVSYIN